MKKILLSCLLLVCLLPACKKYEFDNSIQGEAVGTFSLQAPVANTILALNAATPDQQVVISWTAAAPGVGEAISYRWVAALKTAPDFEAANRILELPSDNKGAATTLTLTHKQIDDALKAKNIAPAQTVELRWTVEAYNSTTTMLATGARQLTVRRMGDGSAPFQLFAPASTTDPVTINPGATADSLRFAWTRSKTAPGGSPVKYTVLFAERKLDDLGKELPVDWSMPLFTYTSAANGLDSFAAISYKDISDSLSTHGLSNVSVPAGLKWTVVAQSGTWNQMSDYVNTLILIREVKLYLVGGSSPAGWNPGAALRFIEDKNRPGVFYMYTYLTTDGFGFKFLSENTDWNTPTQKIYGEASGGANSGVLVMSGGSGNIATPQGDGVYRITVDILGNKYWVQKMHGRMGIVGGGTNAGWNPSAVFPAQEMGFLQTNLFLGITNISQDGEFKMLDYDAWGNGNVDFTRDYEDAGNGNIREESGPNFKWTNASGPVRVIWDYRNVVVPKANISSAAEMRVVGNGMPNQPEWNPGGSPKMTYKGAGKWEITLALTGGREIKFVAGDNWNALDYEDAGNGKIKWDGNDNFKTPAADGTYTIVLDEYKGTVSFN